MARVKGGIKKEEETAFQKAMKKLKQKQQSNTVMPGNTKGVMSDKKRIAELSKSLIKKADLKGAISEKEMEFFIKLANKKNK